MSEETTKNVLIAIDASEYSANALKWYLKTLYRPDHKLTLLHVAEYPKVAVFDMRAVTPEMWQSLWEQKKEATKQLEEDYAQKLKENKIPGVVKGLFGCEPGEAIVSAALEQKSEFIVMGSRGMSSIRRTLLGGISDYVTQHAECPVIICRDSSQ